MQQALKNCFVLQTFYFIWKIYSKFMFIVFVYGIFRSTGAKGCTRRMYVKRFSGSLPCVNHWRRVSWESKILLLQNRRLLSYRLLIPLAGKSNIVVLASYRIGVRWLISMMSLKLISLVVLLNILSIFIAI